MRIKILKLLDCVLGSFIALMVKGKEAQSVDRKASGSILIIRPGGIGDAVFLLPFLRALRQGPTPPRVDILCEKRNKQIFESQGKFLDAVHCYDSLNSFCGLLRNSYDVIIDSEQWHYSSGLISYFLNHQHSVGFATRPLRAKLFDCPVGYEMDAYEIENFRKLFSRVLPDSQAIQDINDCFAIEESVAQWAEATIPAHSVSIFLGASIVPRRLNRNQGLELIRYVLRKNYHVVLLGGTDVGAQAEAIARQTGDARLFNFAGKLSLIQSAALIKRSKVFVGPDSGLMHLACAVGTPVIGIFGPGNLKKWAPRGKDHVVITENVECSPCTRFGYTVPTCRGRYMCMREINIKKIFLAIDQQMQMASSESSRRD